MISILDDSPARPLTPMLANIRSRHETAQARHAALKENYDDCMREALTLDVRAGRRSEVYAGNTYSGTLITNFLMEGSITDLANSWAFMGAYSLAKDVDPYKPLATGQLKHVTGGETTQTNPTNFEPATGSTVGAITVIPVWYSTPMRASASDLNSGLRIEDLRAKAVATFSDSVVQAATAPITAANFTATPLVRAASGFNLSDTATLQGQLQKTPIKNLILDGTYLGRISNQPGYFQKAGQGLNDPFGYKPYGWDAIYLASNWTGAGNNIKGFACNPQAIVRATGVPLNFPGGNTLSSENFELPGSGIVAQVNSWFSLASRTFFTTFDIIAAFAAADLTAGVVIANGTPS